LGGRGVTGFQASKMLTGTAVCSAVCGVDCTLVAAGRWG